MLKAVTFKTDSEAVELFDKLYQINTESRQGLTKGAFFEEMVNQFANPKTITDPLQKLVIEDLQTQLADQQKANDDLSQELNNYFEQSKHELTFINNVRSMLSLQPDATGDEIVTEIRATQQRAMNALISQRPLNEDEILFSIPQPHLALLQETVKRLSVKMGTDITIKDVLLDMFARYTIEQFSEWFYPFVIKGDDDFNTITGFTQKQLKAWLKTK
jgi:hypothetical protein